MKRILLPTDFSPAAENAFRYAFGLFNQEVCEYVLVHGFGEPFSHVKTHDWHTYQDIVLRVEEDLKATATRLQAFINPDRQYLRRLALAAEPVYLIDRIIELEHIDWIVLGTTGRGDAFRFGNVATQLIRQNHCNILLIPAHCEPAPLREVLLATDYAPLQSLDTFGPLRALLHQHQARLTLLTITDQQHPLLLDQPEKVAPVQDYFGALQTQVIVEQHPDILDGIEHYTDSHPVDLLVAVSHHHSFWDAVFNRSLTRKLANRPLVPLAVLADQQPEMGKQVRWQVDNIIF